MSPIPTVTQVSAGGVAFREQAGRVEVALILVGPRKRWQLPKGAINNGESIEAAALREVREETGLTAEMVGELRVIEYWFFANRDDRRVRYHKYVHFFLMRYLSGSVEDHDHEVEEARWFPIDDAIEALSFDSEKEVMRLARGQIFPQVLTDETVQGES